MEKIWTSPMRWVVLGIFSVLSLQQSLVWLTFGAVAPAAKSFYGVSDGTVFLWAAYGPIWYLIFGAPVAWLNQKYGLRLTCLIGAGLSVGCGICRSFATGPNIGSIVLLHLGQALNGINGPVVLGLVTELSMTWFPATERGVATGIALLANSIGSSIGFLWIPWAVEELGMVAMLRYTGILAYITAVAMLFFFPHSPALPPSKSAALIREAMPLPHCGSSWSRFFVLGSSTSREVSTNALLSESFDMEPVTPRTHETVTKDALHSRETLWESLRAVNRSRDFWLLAMAFSISCGFFCGWSSALSILLSGKPWNFSDSSDLSHTSIANSIPWIGFFTTLGSVTGGILSGILIDKVPAHRMVLLVVMTVSTAIYIIWSLIYFQYIHASPLTLFLLSIFGSVGLNGVGTVFMELAAEVTYPVPESVSGGIVQWLINVWALAFELSGLSPKLQENPGVLNWLLPASAVVAVILLLFVSNTKRRLALDVPHHHLPTEEGAASAFALN